MSDRVLPKVSFDHTDPGLRPFIEVEAKIILDVFAQARDEVWSARDLVERVADTATSDAEAGAREMSEQVPSTRRLLPVCQEGCAYCCHGPVFASSAEILRVAAHLRATRSPDELAALRTRAKETAARVAPLDLEQRAVEKVPCPLLDQASGRCGVYPVRPIACRAYHSGSVEACKKGFDACETNPLLPINPALFHVAHAYSFGMMTACAAEGLDPGPYDLAVALPAALDDDLSARWVAGERVLPSTAVSERMREGYVTTLGELSADLRAGRLDAASRVAAKLDPDARRRERNKKKRERRKNG
ncbi:MAG: YkgJ family cysteine cluster protein [Labilithrix sp.]|nr:YkgJ family cysteine cluster protein [Labilithrix sp.]